MFHGLAKTMIQFFSISAQHCTYLVWWVHRSFTFGDLFQDLFDCGAPSQKLCLLVTSFDVLLNDTNQSWHIVKACPADSDTSLRH
jgi:hypothetical protein